MFKVSAKKGKELLEKPKVSHLKKYLIILQRGKTPANIMQPPAGDTLVWQFCFY